MGENLNTRNTVLVIASNHNQIINARMENINLKKKKLQDFRVQIKFNINMDIKSKVFCIFIIIVGQKSTQAFLY